MGWGRGETRRGVLVLAPLGQVPVTVGGSGRLFARGRSQGISRADLPPSAACGPVRGGGTGCSARRAGLPAHGPTGPLLHHPASALPIALGSP
jgi:hypothetical protein